MYKSLKQGKQYFFPVLVFIISFIFICVLFTKKDSSVPTNSRIYTYENTVIELYNFIKHNPGGGIGTIVIIQDLN